MAFDPIAAGTEFGTAMALESILMIREYLWGYRKGVSIDPGASERVFWIKCQLFLIFEGGWRALIVYLAPGSHRKSRFQVHPRASRTTKKLCFRGLVGLEWSCEASLSHRRNLPQYHHAKLHTIASNFLIVVVDWDLLNAPQFGLNSPCRPPAHWLPECAPWAVPQPTEVATARRGV